MNPKDSILDFNAMRLGARTEFRWYRTIWSESYQGHPDAEVSKVFLPFIPFVYAYVWLKFYRNGCFCEIPPEDRSQDVYPLSGKHQYYYLFVH